MVTITTEQMIKAFKRIAPDATITNYRGCIRVNQPTGMSFSIYDTGALNIDTRTDRWLRDVAGVVKASNDLEELKGIFFFVEKFKNNFGFIRRKETVNAGP